MSLEECKRIYDERLERARTRSKIEGERRHASGWVDDGKVEIDFYAEHIGMSFQTWIVAVFSIKYSARSKKEFQRKDKERAEKYFKKLIKDYGLKEEK